MQVARMVLARLTGRHGAALRLARELDAEIARTGRSTWPSRDCSAIRTFFQAARSRITELYGDDFDAARRNCFAVIEGRAAGMDWPMIGLSASNLLALTAALSGGMPTAREWAEASRADDLTGERALRLSGLRLAVRPGGHRPRASSMPPKRRRCSAPSMRPRRATSSTGPYLVHAEHVAALIDGSERQGAQPTRGTRGSPAGGCPPARTSPRSSRCGPCGPPARGGAQIDRAESLLADTKVASPEAMLAQARIHGRARAARSRARCCAAVVPLPRPRRRHRGAPPGSGRRHRLEPGSGTAYAREAVAALEEAGLRRPLMMVRQDWLRSALAEAIGADAVESMLADVPDPFGRVRTAERLSRRERLVLAELYSEGRRRRWRAASTSRRTP